MATNYQFKQGDCIYCIIHEHGFLADTVWNHSNNAQLKEMRKTLDMLLPGDLVFIPDIRPKEVREQTNQVYKFRMKQATHKHWIEIELVGEDNKPIPNMKYNLTSPDGVIKDGNLDQSGWARIESLATGECKIVFPELDEKACEFIETTSAKVKSS